MTEQKNRRQPETVMMAGMEFNQLSVANAFLILAVRVVVNNVSFVTELLNSPLNFKKR